MNPATPVMHDARRLVDAGLMNGRPHARFVIGVADARPAYAICAGSGSIGLP